MKTSSIKIKELLDKLRGDILCGYLKAGDRLPTVRQLMDDFNLSQGSVSRNINVLCEQGLVSKKAGSGVYVNTLSETHAHSTDYHITVFASQSSELFCDEETMLANIFLGIKDTAKCQIMLINTNQRILSDKELEKANKESDAIILLGEYDIKETEFNLQVPAVGVFMHNTYNGKLSLIGIDPFDAAQKAVEYFQQYNLKQVHIISSRLPVFYFRAKTFEIYWRQHIGSILFSPEDSIIDFQAGHGYFFSSDSICQIYCEEFHRQTGKKLHKFAHIFSIDGKRYLPNHSKVFDDFPSYAVDWKYVGRCAYEECIYQINNIGVANRRISIVGQLKGAESR